MYYNNLTGYVIIYFCSLLFEANIYIGHQPAKVIQVQEEKLLIIFVLFLAHNLCDSRSPKIIELQGKEYHQAEPGHGSIIFQQTLILV